MLYMGCQILVVFGRWLEFVNLRIIENLNYLKGFKITNNYLLC